MGRLEKIVVVTVLFLVAIILGISLNSGPEAGEKNPGNGRGLAGRPPASTGEVAKGPVENPANSALPNVPGDKPTGASVGLMNTAVAPEAKAQPSAAPGARATPKGGAQPQPSDNSAPAAAPALQTPAAVQYLVSSEGLEPTKSEDFMLYTWKAGDTFGALAQRFYGSNLHVNRIKVANEGVDEKALAAGAKINISVKATSAENLIARSVPKPDENAAGESKWTGGPYTVKTGDVLGSISAQVYGTSKKWKKIYDANRDVIGDDPNKLKVGSKLRIPE